MLVILFTITTTATNTLIAKMQYNQITSVAFMTTIILFRSLLLFDHSQATTSTNTTQLKTNVNQTCKINSGVKQQWNKQWNWLIHLLNIEWWEDELSIHMPYACALLIHHQPVDYFLQLIRLQLTRMFCCRYSWLYLYLIWYYWFCDLLIIAIEFYLCQLLCIVPMVVIITWHHPHGL